MNATTELINYVLLINPEHNELGAGFMANLIALAKRAQKEQNETSEEQDVPWIRQMADDPKPKRYSRVKFKDGVESDYCYWSDRAWNYGGPDETRHIEFYKP
jgi:hypothetical protein